MLIELFILSIYWLGGWLVYLEAGNNQTLHSPATITARTTATYLTRDTLLQWPPQTVNPLDKRHSSHLQFSTFNVFKHIFGYNSNLSSTTVSLLLTDTYRVSLYLCLWTPIECS